MLLCEKKYKCLNSFIIFQPLNSEITTEPFMVTLFLTVPLHVVS